MLHGIWTVLQFYAVSLLSVKNLYMCIYVCSGVRPLCGRYLSYPSRPALGITCIPVPDLLPPCRVAGVLLWLRSQFQRQQCVSVDLYTVYIYHLPAFCSFRACLVRNLPFVTYIHTQSGVSFCDGSFYDPCRVWRSSSSVRSVLSALLVLVRCACVSYFIF